MRPRCNRLQAGGVKEIWIMRRRRAAALLFLGLLAAVPAARAQGTAADYERAMTLRETTSPSRWTSSIRSAGSGRRTGSGIDGPSRAAASSCWSMPRRVRKGQRSITRSWRRRCRRRPAESTPRSHSPSTTFTFVDDGAAIEFTLNGPGGRAAAPGPVDGRRPGAARSRRTTAGSRPRRGPRRARRWRTRRPCPGAIRHQRRRPEEVSRRQARSARAQLQRRRSATSGTRDVRLLSTDGSEGTTTIPSRSSGRRTRRSSPSTRSARLSAATCTTSNRRRRISCSRRTRRCSMRSRATCSTSSVP